MLTKILFIINPLIKKRKKRAILGAIRQFIDTSIIDFRIEFTTYCGHAPVIVRENLDKYDVFVAVGGDGTVNEIGKSLLGTQKILGIIPAGSGNGFARSLGIPLNFSKAIQKINQLQVKTTDTARIANIPFINIAGTGFDAVVAEKFAHFGKRGFMSYFFLAVKEYYSYKSQDYELIADGVKHSFKAFVVVFANSSQFGYNATISPKSEIDDGYLEICILKKFPVFHLPVLAMMLFNNLIDKTKYMEIIRAKKAQLITTSALPGHIDGEPFTMEQSPEVTIVPMSLKVLV